MTTEHDVVEAVRTLIEWAGDDPDRIGVEDTPKRVLRAWRDAWGAGYREDPAQHLERQFTDDDLSEQGAHDALVCVGPIPFASTCEHHMAPFIGRGWIVYLPDQRVVGLSKLARCLTGYAARLQVQERIGHQVAEAIDRVMKPRGVMVVLEAEHTCMTTRGVRAHGCMTRTSAVRGVLMDNPAARAEAMALVSM